MPFADIQRNWQALCDYISDGRIPIDNKSAETVDEAQVALRRKAAQLFVANAGSGEQSAMVSLVSSAKRHDLNTWLYIKGVLDQLLEALTKYELRHGEAVSIGVAVDTVYSSLAFNLDEATMLQTLETLVRLQLPIYHPQLRDEQILSGFEEFRQHLGGRLTLTMLAALGQPVAIHDIDRPLMQTAIDFVESFVNRYSKHPIK